MNHPMQPQQWPELAAVLRQEPSRIQARMIARNGNGIQLAVSL